VHRLQLNYTLSREATPAVVRNRLIDLLQAISNRGSISGGARALGLSYRHVWGELKRWEDELGNELLVWEKGQSARLTPFASKLMWAERQAQARLAPQIEALRAEIERSYSLAFDDNQHVLTIYASHDEAISALREHAWRGEPLDHAPLQGLHLDVRFMGSVDAIRALNEERCVVAGFHTLIDTARHSHSERAYKRLLQPGKHKLIGFAGRTQGLMVAKGNPLQLHSLHDVAAQGARFVQRARGTGTRVVLDELLARAGLHNSDIRGEAEGEPSHTAVAQAIASGQYDVGLGIAAAAHHAGLDFVPLTEERYHLVCLKSALELPGVQALRTLLQTPAWQERVAAIPGYTPAQSGQVLAMRSVLPWWTFKQPKA
jgi:putative molybdopterin biosynthesis protein